MLRKTLLISLSLVALQAHASAWRWIDADGSVTYGDRPPPGAQRVSERTTEIAAQERNDGAMPFAVRAAATRFPVRLYTTRECTPCDAARTYLTERGVPFTERTLQTRDDETAFRKLGFAEFQSPALSVGRERAQGFTPDAWNLLLDAAGYPKTSLMPRGWRPAPAEPLVATPSPQRPGWPAGGQAAGDAQPPSPFGGNATAAYPYPAPQAEPATSLRF